MERKKVTINLELVVPTTWDDELLLSLVKSTLNVAFFRDGGTFKTGVEKIQVVKTEEVDN